jgi:ribose transport system permease protein
VSTAVHALDAPGRLRRLQRFVADNPALILVVVLVALLVITDLINRHQTGSPFVTWKQLSTTFLVAAPLGLIAGGQTLVMLTGGVDLSIAFIATAAAYVTAWQGGSGTATALLFGLATGAVIGLVNGVGVAVFRVNPLIMTLGVGSVLFGMLSIYAGRAFEKTIPGVVSSLGTERFFGYLPVNVLLWAPVAAVLILGLRYTGSMPSVTTQSPRDWPASASGRSCSSPTCSAGCWRRWAGCSCSASSGTPISGSPRPTSCPRSRRS